MGSTLAPCGHKASCSQASCCGRGGSPTDGLTDMPEAEAPLKSFGKRVSVVQAAGHQKTIRMDTEDTQYILKPYDEAEKRNYEEIWAEHGTDPMRGYAAPFGGVIEVQLGCSGATGGSSSSQKFLRLGNLLRDLDDVLIMDVKMGFRTFMESEANNPKPRQDLYEKLKKLAPDRLSAADHAAQAITKFQWMTTNDGLKTTKQFAFRVDGITSRDGVRATSKELDSIRTLEEVLPMLVRLLPRAVTGDDALRRKRKAVARQIVSQLELLQCSLENSPFFCSHEFIGASLLFLAHSYGASVHLIDLAKTAKVPENLTIDHRSPWKMGNHEDGFLFGLEALTDCWRRVLVELEKASASSSTGIFLSTQYDNEMSQLEQMLKKHDVDVSLFGCGSAKSLQELHCDIYIEKVASMQVYPGGKISRVAELVRAWIVADISRSSSTAHVLMGQYPKTSASGETSYITKTFAKKMKPEESWKITLQRCLTSRFGLPQEIVDDHFQIRSDTYRLNIEEKMGSVEVRGGYPGLCSVYRIHEVDVHVREPKSPELAAIGLPGGLDFVTVKHSGYFGSSLRNWTWLPRSDAIDQRTLA